MWLWFRIQACTGCKDVKTTTEVNGCDKFGMNMVVPRSQAHWQSLYKYVTVELKSTMDSHFKVVPGISKSVGGRNDCKGANYNDRVHAETHRLCLCLILLFRVLHIVPSQYWCRR